MIPKEYERNQMKSRNLTDNRLLRVAGEWLNL